MIANAWFYTCHGRLVRAARRRHGWKPDIARPVRVTERMLWRKLVDKNPLFGTFCDKLAAKDYVKARCPQLAVARTLWTGLNADEIPDEVLRGDVYVKASHGCDFNLRVSGGAVDRRYLRTLTDGWLAQSYGRVHGESAYFALVPRLFVEEAVGDTETGMVEFQIRAGRGKCILGSVVGHAKTPRQWAVYLDENGVARTTSVGVVQGLRPELPEGLDIKAAYREAWNFARILSADVDYARFDFLWNGATLYGGEITVYPGAGIGEIYDPEVNRLIHAKWLLENTWFLTTPQPWPVRVYANAMRRWLAETSATRD